MNKRMFHKKLDKEYHRARMAAAAIKFMIEMTPDILALPDDPVFTEREPPYDQDSNNE